MIEDGGGSEGVVEAVAPGLALGSAGLLPKRGPVFEVDVVVSVAGLPNENPELV